MLNGVTLVYGSGLLLSLWAVFSPDWRWRGREISIAYKALGIVLLFAWSSLTVRQYFHGTRLAGGGMNDAELYSYSAAWLATGLGLLAFGISRRSRTIRLASLGFILATVCKVFLWDAAELQGLYRVGSFLGLGLSLIGLSYFYTKFVARRDAS